MIVFRYDKTFEGLLSAVFDAYDRRNFPEKLLGESDISPLFANDTHNVVTQKDKSERVWKGIQKKTSKYAQNTIIYAWLSEINNIDELIFRYICKTFNSKDSIETNYIDKDILELKKIALKVNHEKSYLHQFVRFQKTADEIYFAPVSPIYNALPLSLEYFKDRFADQKWLLYDTKRKYGYYYDLKEISEVSIELDNNIVNGKITDNIMAEDEKLFQNLWKTYFKSMAIKERINPKLHRQNLPQRFWKYLTEKQ